MHLDSAYRWARGVEDARIGLAGTTAGFAGYGFYGTDLSNRVRYLGEDGPHGAFNAIPTCAAFRAAVNDADLDYLVTAPFLNFLHPGDPVASPEARWLRGEGAVRPVLRSGPVTVWKVEGELSPGACGPANAPLREIPTPQLSKLSNIFCSIVIIFPIAMTSCALTSASFELGSTSSLRPPPRRQEQFSALRERCGSSTSGSPVANH